MNTLILLDFYLNRKFTMKHYYIVVLVICSLFGGLYAANRAYPSLIQATIDNKPDQVTQLLGLSFDRPRQPVFILQRDKYRRTAHMYALMLNHTRILDILFAQTCYQHYKRMIDVNNSSILHYAVAAGNENLVRKLLSIIRNYPDLRFCLLCPNNQAKTPKHLACDKGYTTIVKLFESYGF